MEGEREGHMKAMGRLQKEVEGGKSRVAKLETALQECREQLYGHMTKAEEDSTHYAVLMQQVSVGGNRNISVVIWFWTKCGNYF